MYWSTSAWLYIGVPSDLYAYADFELEDDDVENVAGRIHPEFLKCGEAMQAIFDLCWKNDVCSISVN